MHAINSDPTPPLFNLQQALQRMGGDKTLLSEMATIFREDVPGLIATIEAGLDAPADDDAIRAAHSIKGLASNFSAVAVVSLAQRLEDALRAGAQAQTRTIFEELRTAVQELINALQHELGLGN